MNRALWHWPALTLSIALIGAILVPLACAPPAAPTGGKPPAVLAGDAAAGKTAYDANCNSCHPGGKAGFGPQLAGTVSRLGAAEVGKVIRNGKGEMPAIPEKDVSAKQLTDLLAYLATLK